jgi:hypothetical protein
LYGFHCGLLSTVYSTVGRTRTEPAF